MARVIHAGLGFGGCHVYPHLSDIHGRRVRVAAGSCATKQRVGHRAADTAVLSLTAWAPSARLSARARPRAVAALLRIALSRIPPGPLPFGSPSPVPLRRHTSIGLLYAWGFLFGPHPPGPHPQPRRPLPRHDHDD